MAKVVVRKSEAEGFYTGTAGDFKIEIERGEIRSPRSIDLVLLGLGSCTIATIAHYLRRKGLPADAVDVELAAHFDEKTGAYGDFSVRLHVVDSIPPETRKVIAGIAKTCRIHRTLESALRISTELAEPSAAPGAPSI
ncbi:MAG: hypothetical protein GEV05_22490 [Betaproteobacteria bacterium]|nr:hypothetical protein [Betaproteobacteria bacterium]